ncbi:MAG: hypothetical protein NUV58_03970, partial [Candidatus Roizmanbacteria bacterium]|nr:hypothetical protein [Candidatus Roizmanbacteria bacterium]
KVSYLPNEVYEIKDFTAQRLLKENLVERVSDDTPVTLTVDFRNVIKEEKAISKAMKEKKEVDLVKKILKLKKKGKK